MNNMNITKEQLTEIINGRKIIDSINIEAVNGKLILHNCEFNDIIWDVDTKDIDFVDCHFNKVKFAKSDDEMVIIENCSFSNCVFNMCYIVADFRSTKFDLETNFMLCHIFCSIFTDCDILSEFNLCDISGTTFKHSLISPCMKMTNSCFRVKDSEINDLLALKSVVTIDTKLDGYSFPSSEIKNICLSYSTFDLISDIAAKYHCKKDTRISYYNSEILVPNLYTRCLNKVDYNLYAHCFCVRYYNLEDTTHRMYYIV